MIEVVYNEPIEVSRKKYRKALSTLGGIIAHRSEKGRYWVKLMVPKYKSKVSKVLNT